jgi:hypothetical protein
VFARKPRGASLPSDLRIRSQIHVQSNTQAGPFFRAVSVRPGDPIEAAGAGGYWVRLHPNGMVSLHSLNQPETRENRPIASSEPVPGFDSSRFHFVEVEASGHRLRVWLDDQPVYLNGKQETTIPANGRSDGAAGIGAYVNGQPFDVITVRNIIISAAR